MVAAVVWIIYMDSMAGGIIYDYLDESTRFCREK